MLQPLSEIAAPAPKLCYAANGGNPGTGARSPELSHGCHNCGSGSSLCPVQVMNHWLAPPMPPAVVLGCGGGGYMLPQNPPGLATYMSMANMAPELTQVGLIVEGWVGHDFSSNFRYSRVLWNVSLLTVEEAPTGSPGEGSFHSREDGNGCITVDRHQCRQPWTSGDVSSAVRLYVQVRLLPFGFILRPLPPAPRGAFPAKA